MDYQKYFQPEQQVLVRNLSGTELQRSEVFSAHLLTCSVEYFDLSLPYQVVSDQSSLFAPGTDFCIISTAMGMGIQVNARLQTQLDPTTLRLVPSGNMEIFGQRHFLRADLTLRCLVQRDRSGYEGVRRQWADAVREVQAGVTPPQISQLSPCKISLGAGGMGIGLPAPVADGELMLVLLDIEDGKPLIWAVGEVVWRKGDEAKVQDIGVRFNDISVDDQTRIDHFVTKHLRLLGHDVEWYASRTKLLEKIRF